VCPWFTQIVTSPVARFRSSRLRSTVDWVFFDSSGWVRIPDPPLDESVFSQVFRSESLLSLYGTVSSRLPNRSISPIPSEWLRLGTDCATSQSVPTTTPTADHSYCGSNSEKIESARRVW